MADIQLSDAEVRTIISGIEANVRADGRTRIQHRPLTIALGPIPHACGSSQVSFSTGGDGEETKVLVSVMADVVEIEGDYEANPRLQRGSLEIHLDCVPTVQMLYGKLYSGGVSMRSNFAATNRGRMAFLSHSTMALSKAFGAKVSLAGATLTAGAEVDFAGNAEEGGAAAAEEAAVDADAAAAGPSSSTGFGSAAERSCASFYEGLYLGNGFAYELHADVNVLQGGGGNLLTAASAGILAALKVMQLPRAEVTVHPDGTASVEVHPKQARTGAPISLHEVPIIVTSCLHKGFYCVDPTLAEETGLPSVATVGVTDQRIITNVAQTAHTGRRAFPEGSTLSSPEDLLALLRDAAEVGADLHDAIDRTVQEASDLAEAQGGAGARGATAVAAIGK